MASGLVVSFQELAERDIQVTDAKLQAVCAKIKRDVAATREWQYRMSEDYLFGEPPTVRERIEAEGAYWLRGIA